MGKLQNGKGNCEGFVSPKAGKTGFTGWDESEVTGQIASKARRPGEVDAMLRSLRDFGGEAVVLKVRVASVDKVQSKVNALANAAKKLDKSKTVKCIARYNLKDGTVGLALEVADRAPRNKDK